MGLKIILLVDVATLHIKSVRGVWQPRWNCALEVSQGV